MRYLARQNRSSLTSDPARKWLIVARRTRSPPTRDHFSLLRSYSCAATLLAIIFQSRNIHCSLSRCYCCDGFFLISPLYFFRSPALARVINIFIVLSPIADCLSYVTAYPFYFSRISATPEYIANAADALRGLHVYIAQREEWNIIRIRSRERLR